MSASSGTASASATSTAAGAQEVTRADSLAIEVLGLPISATTLSDEVSCPAASVATGSTTVTGLTVFGRPVEVRVNGAPTTVTSPIPVPGLSNATMTATVRSFVQLTDTTARVGALQLGFELVATAGGGPVRVQLGSIDAGSATCAPSYPPRPSNPDAPTVMAVTPSSASVDGGTQLTVTRSGFVPGQTSVDVGRGAPASVVTVLSPTRLTVAAPGYSVRQTDLSVTTPNGTSGTIKFYYVPPPGTPVTAPTAKLLYPSAGRTVCCTSVQVEGSGFIPGATTVRVDGIVVPAGKVTVDGEAEMSLEIQGHEAGLAQVTVSTPGGTSAPLGFTFVPVDQPVPPGPTVTYAPLNPSSGPVGGGTTVVVTGSGFVPGQTTVTVDEVALTASAVTVTDPTRLTFVTPPHSIGLTFLTIRTPFGSILPIGFSYLPPVAPPPPPAVLTVSDGVGSAGPVSASSAAVVRETAPRPETGVQAGSPLANTGVAVGPQVTVAMPTLLTGLLLVGVTRRRRQ